MTPDEREIAGVKPGAAGPGGAPGPGGEAAEGPAGEGHSGPAGQVGRHGIARPLLLIP